MLCDSAMCVTNSAVCFAGAEVRRLMAKAFKGPLVLQQQQVKNDMEEKIPKTEREIKLQGIILLFPL